MPDIAKLTVEVTPKGIAEAKKQLDELAKTGKETEKTTMSMMDKFRNMQAVMQGPVAAFGVLTRGMKQLYAAGKELTDLYAVQERAVSNLDAVLKATGGTVGLTSRELQDMASAFQEVTLFGDEAIIGMNAVLLGFRGIRGDQFERTTEAILDMATIMGGDLVGAAQQLGKALDSPIQGMGALGKVGFIFTDQQKEMVKVLEESGDLLGAQEIILGEVEKAFGGAARAAGDTSTGAFTKLSGVISDMKEGFGQVIADGMNPFVVKLTNIIREANNASTALRNMFYGGTDTARAIVEVQDVLALAERDRAAFEKKYVRGNMLGIGTDQTIEMYEKRLAVLLLQAEELKRLDAALGSQTPKTKTGGGGGGGPSDDQIASELGNDAYQRVVAMEQAEQRRVDTFGELIDYQSLSNSAWKEAKKLLEDSNGLISTSNPLYQRLVDTAVEFARSAEIPVGSLEIIPDKLKAAADAAKKLDDEIKAVKSRFADPSEQIISDMERLGELFTMGKIDADLYTRAIAELQGQLANLKPALTDYEIAIIAIETAMQNSLKQGYVDSFKAIGEALATGANAGEGLAMALADMGIQMLNQLPMLLLNAGLTAMLKPATFGLGVALVAASGIVAIGAGAANSARSSVTANALGGVYDSPSLSAYSGQVVNQPTMFAFAKGAGLMGEAGPEAIMPLSRGSDGKLGVKASGSSVSVVINNNASGTVANAAETTNSDGSKQIIVTVENIMRGAFATGKMDSSMGRYGVRPQGVRG